MDLFLILIWNFGYVGVWYLKEEVVGIGIVDFYKDGIFNGNDGYDIVIVIGSVGKVGLGQEFFVVVYDLINCGFDVSLNIIGLELMMEVWVYMDGQFLFGEWYNVVSKNEYSIYLYGKKDIEIRLGVYILMDKDEYDLWKEGLVYVFDVIWIYVVIFFDGDNIMGYINGVLRWIENGFNFEIIDDFFDNNFFIGVYNIENDMYMNGLIDEVCIFNVIRFVGWIVV